MRELVDTLDVSVTSEPSRKALFAERLRMVMVEKKLSVSELARLIQQHLPDEKFNSVNISHYRSGRSLPRPRILRALNLALGQDIDVGLAGASPKSESPRNASSFTGTIRGDDVTSGAETPNLPSFRLQDLEGGEAWIQINQRLSWPTIIKLLQVLKCEDKG
jgi:transcriptional regulator with XRE-family HTH domain